MLFPSLLKLDHLSGSIVVKKRLKRFFIFIFIFAILFSEAIITPQLTEAQGSLTEPEDVKQVEHPNNTPVAAFFGGAYVDSTDDPGTGVSAHNENNVDIAIGEEFNFIVTYTFPEGTTENFISIDVTTPITGTLPAERQKRVIELLSAQVIHLGDNLSGPGVRAEGFNFSLSDAYVDGDNDRVQLVGSGSRNVVNAVDGVINDDDRYVIRIRARVDDEDNAGGAADSDNGGLRENRDGDVATNRVQTQWTDGGVQNTVNTFANIDIVEPNVTVSKSTIAGTDLQAGDTATFELEISNTGTAPAYNLGVIDTLPNNGGTNFLAFAAFDSANSTCDEQSGFTVNSGAAPNVVFSFADLAAGSSCIVRFNATIQPNVPVGDYTNSATVTSYDSRDNAANADNRNYSGGSDTSVITVVDCVSITANTFAQLQAAVTDYNNNCLDGETLTVDLDGNTIQYTTALPALTNATTAELVIKDGTLDADGRGHVLLMLDGTATFDTTLLTGGSGPNGGAIQVEPNANVTLVNTTVTGNSSVTAAALLNNGGTMTLSNVTVSANTISAANNSLGSVWNRINGANVPTLNLNNTLIANTIDTNGLAVPDCRNNAGTINFSASTSNLIEQDQAGGVACDLAGTNTLSGDPVLGPLQDNGGQSHTLALLAGSAAINAADDAVCAASPIDGVDQRGITRPQSTTCDIGAFEFDDLSSLTIVKQATPEDGTDFSFTSDIPGGSTFTLDDEASQTDSISQSITIVDLVPGTYAITETLPADWQLDSASCTGGSDPGNLSGATLAVALGAGETMTCTFTNSQLPDLQLSKDDGGVTGVPGGTISYTLTYTNAGDSPANGVVLTETVPANTRFNAGASTAGWSCAPNNQAGSACTLAVGAVAAGNSGSADFAVNVDLPLLAGVTEISNTAEIGDDGSRGGDLNPGDNSASDTTPLIASPDMQIDKDDRGRIAEAGETILYSLAITNTGSQNATGVVMTDTVPAHTTFNAGASSAGWSCANGASAGTPCAFDLSAIIGGQFDGDEDLVVLVTFAVDVVDPLPAGVVQIENTIVVSDDGSSGPDGNPLDNQDSEITPLDVPGTIIIEKVTDPATFGIPPTTADVFTFTHNITTPTTFNLERGQMQTFTNIPAGAYTVTEDDPTPFGFDLTELSCDDGNSSGDVGGRTATINLDYGETVTCTFTNTQRGVIRIVKESQPKSANDFIFGGDLGPFTLDDPGLDDGDAFGNAITFSDLPTGVYTVTEQILDDGFGLNLLVCDDPSSPNPSVVDLSSRTAVIHLDPAEFVICTFTNLRTEPLRTFLPLIANQFAVGPDLLVDEVLAITAAVTVTIRNVGNAPVVDAFWVDLYIDPNKEPAVNEPWNVIAPQGVVWGVDGADLPINPGESRVLTLSNAESGVTLTSPPPYPAGAAVYVLVDSIDTSTPFGAIQETNEDNNLAEDVVTTAGDTEP